MASLFAISGSGLTVAYSVGVGSTPVQQGALAGKLRLPTDPIGTTTLTFDGVSAGTEIRVYLPDGPNGSAGTEIAGLDSCALMQQLTWPVYAPGSPNNTVWIHLIKRGLRWQKFPYQSKAGNQSIPIFQNIDLGYNNPA